MCFGFLPGILNAAKQPQLNKEYSLIDAKRDSNNGVVEVVEFFSYACVHCFKFEPALEQWLGRTNSEMTFKRMPAIFSDRMVPLAKLYYTLDDMKILDKFHNVVFGNIHTGKRKMFSKKAIREWVSDEPEINYDDFIKIYDSFAVGKKIREAKKLTRNYRVPGTPYITVGGMFLTGPSMISENNNTHNNGSNTMRLFEVIEELVKMAGKN